MQPCHQKVLTLDNASFDLEIDSSDQPILVDFWADWCGPCKAIAPVINELACDFDGLVKVAKVDVDSNPALAQKFGIGSIPSMLLFHRGEIVERVSGVVPKKTLADRLRGIIERAAENN